MYWRTYRSRLITASTVAEAHSAPPSMIQSASSYQRFGAISNRKQWKAPWASARLRSADDEAHAGDRRPEARRFWSLHLIVIGGVGCGMGGGGPSTVGG